MELEERLGIRLKEKGWRLAVVETTTGGLICYRIVSVPGSSHYFDRGIVAYSQAAKEELLGIPAELVKQFGSVSAPMAIALAEGIQRISQTDLGLAETGIAGPIRGRSPKPVGTSYLALATPTGTQCQEYQFRGNRIEILHAISQQALETLVKTVES
ncbi:MAG: CinA family protein [Candidatus Tectomicrobia bacterium]|uniref:CinA family protein n=1 Tax=Tectimicrobiota bacterium TaxID=2528274 RepID=A0A932CLN0_UNCTE|nr:CinA family protein [Candidatus Tectomicrobia bacterium]